MTRADASLVRCSWPLLEAPRHFELGRILNGVISDILEPGSVGELGAHHVGMWECDLADQSLTWSGGVYDIFGLPRGVPVTRHQAVALYCESSRAVMERLRAYAIAHRCGFTLDAEIRPEVGKRRWIRLIAAPAEEDGRSVRLHGLKVAI